MTKLVNNIKKKEDELKLLRLTCHLVLQKITNDVEDGAPVDMEKCLNLHFPEDRAENLTGSSIRYVDSATLWFE